MSGSSDLNGHEPTTAAAPEERSKLSSASGGAAKTDAAWPPLWVGLAAVVVYVALAAGIANLLTDTITTRTEAADFALGHYPVLVPLVAAAVVLVRRRGWSAAVWRAPAPWEPAGRLGVMTAPSDAAGPQRRRRRWWLLAFPVLLAAQVVLLLVSTPWSQRDVTLIVVVLLGTLLVGVGEELYFRGILRASLGRHGQTVTLLVTSVLFGAAHSAASLGGGLPVSFVAFQVVVTAAAGAVLYGVLRATGRLWVAMLLHGLNDAGLYLNSGSTDSPAATDITAGSANIALQAALWVLAVILLISCLRQDHQARRQRHAHPSEAGQTPSRPPS